MQSQIQGVKEKETVKMCFIFTSYKYGDFHMCFLSYFWSKVLGSEGKVESYLLSPRYRHRRSRMKKAMSAIHYNYNRFTDKSYFSKTRKYCPRVCQVSVSVVLYFISGKK